MSREHAHADRANASTSGPAQACSEVVSFCVCSPSRRQLLLPKVFVELGEIAPGPSRQQGVVEPGSDHDRQQDDGVEDQADVGPAEDGEQGRNIKPMTAGTAVSTQVTRR